MSTLRMIKIFVRRTRMVLSLLYIGFIALLTWCIPANATELRDIRVGEYNGFTRIVFELDEPAINPGVEIQSANQLLVTFHKTSANLVRHIPVEPSPHLDEIQFWQRKAALSTLLFFDYPHIRLESFRLSRPPRFAVDVFPVAKPTQDKYTGNTAPAKTANAEDQNKTIKGIPEPSPVQNDTQSEPANKQSVPATEISDKDAPPLSTEATGLPQASKPLLKESDDAASATEQDASLPGESVIQASSETATEEIQPSLLNQPMDEGEGVSSEQDGSSSAQRVRGDSSKAEVDAVQSPVLPPPPISESANDIQGDADNPAQTTPPSGNRLQFYLVIILVIISIAILVLLLLMLLNRHHLFYDKNELSKAEISQHQDKHVIAQLDVNIKEQLRRYDEA